MTGSNARTSGSRLRWILGFCFATVLASASLWQLLAAELGTSPRANDRQVTKVVTSLLRKEHLSRHPLDNEISRRGLKSFLKTLDPLKMYFNQSDIDEFMTHQDELDDLLKDNDISFAYTVFSKFLARVNERINLIHEMIATNHDFNVQEEMGTDLETMAYSKNDAETHERWRKKIKYDILVLKGEKVEVEEIRKRLTRRYHGFAKRMHQFDADELLEMYLTAMTTSFDPHTTYMSPSTQDNFEIQMRLQLEGIGAALQLIDGYTVVSKVIPGGAADKDGRLKPEDRVVGVGQGESGEVTDVVDMKLNDVVSLIRGKAGTVVRLSVLSPATTEVKVITITRAKVELKDSEARGVIFEEGKKPSGAPLKVGVIDLPSFYMDMQGAKQNLNNFKSSTNDVRRLLEDFNDKGVDVVILDLRHNGGGSLTEAINLTGLFIDQGPVVQVKDPDGRVQHYDDLDEGMVWKGPLVVVTSKFSASASEILAGAIQDYQRGLIVGDDATHGKGTVQSLLDVGAQLFRGPARPPNLGALKITMQQFYRPNGDSTQKRGVLADIKMPSITNHMDVSESDLDFALEFDRVPAARFPKYDFVTPEIISRLSTSSTTRRGEGEEFAKQAKNIERYRTIKAKKSVSLNEAEFFAQRKDIDTDKEEEKILDKQTNGQEEIVKRDFYFNEVIKIAQDYVQNLGTKKVVKAN